ncbi:P-loop containing nucleoside triphosphate hydrolase protein [Immersiella caudata]|uniref:P-loop containing nucleoside triphosphate hydrolase protein n=1 Tax=Immersiella caudata TaxID=314043 RepID=A0AA40C7D9_9PEZI|nr:P-loop containing nucleoside triphosphate hydrolase protein [Immersiella caudata]
MEAASLDVSEPHTAVNLDDAAMQQLQAEQRALLDTIETLKGLGLGEFVDLPQLVVVGDQSAGKSSVLEAISRVRFPIKDGICTRFATELALRRGHHPKIEVKVQSKISSTPFSRSGFENGDLPRIVEEAKQHMGIGEGSTGFSEDVLHIKIIGPDMPQLTLVDLPGFFHSETENQSASGIAIANRLAEKYMRQENSIILAVISAAAEAAQQTVLGQTQRHDPARSRTLGIITKPDKVEPDSDNERAYLRMAQNEEATHKLALGWHVLRNRAQKETSSADAERDEKEKLFFESGVWSVISPQDRGIETLREKLSQVLLQHIQRQLPSLITSIDEQIKVHQARLDGLGEKRSSTIEIKKYLIDLSSRYERVAREAIHGNYADPFFGGLYPDSETSYEARRVKKLRALVRDLNRAFYFVLTTEGSRRQIQWPDDLHCKLSDSQPPDHLKPLVELYDTGDPTDEVLVSDLILELDTIAAENQGVEFPGSSNDRVALALFRDHSTPWEGLALQHCDLVTHFAREFVEHLVSHITGPDTHTADAIINDIVTPYFEEKLTVLHAKVSELVRHYKTGSDPQPMFSIFIKNLEERKNKRLAKMLKQNPGLFQNAESQALTLEALQAELKEASEFNAEGTIDSAMVYYDMSLRVFTDNVMTLALENCLISDIPNILSPGQVYSMSDEKVAVLAAESKPVQRLRQELQTDLEKLRAGFSACRKHRSRESIGKLTHLPHPLHHSGHGLTGEV